MRPTYVITCPAGIPRHEKPDPLPHRGEELRVGERLHPVRLLLVVVLSVSSSLLTSAPSHLIWCRVEELRPRLLLVVVVVHRLLGDAAAGLACHPAGMGLLLPEEGLDVAAHRGSLSSEEDAAVVSLPSCSSRRG